MSVLKNFIQNWSTIDLDYKTFIITEDMCDVVVDSTKWVAPYNTSYWMTWITIKDWYWIEWREWWMYRFIISSNLVVASATRNVGIRIGTSWTYIPVKNRANTILAWSTYFAKWRTDEYMYKTTYETWWALHLSAGSDTTYSALTAANVTSANTTAKVVSWKIFKDSVTALAVLLTWDQTVAWTKTFSTSPVVPSKTSAATNTGTAIATEAQVYLKANTSDVLTKTNTTSFTPSANYHPATKKYVDDTAAWKVSDTAYAASWDWVTSVAPSKNAVYDHFLEIQPTVMTASQYSQVSNPVAGKIYFIKKS